MAKNMENLRGIALEVVAKEAEAVRKLSEAIDDNFSQVVELIHGIKGRVIVAGMGKSGIIANKIVATMNSTGTKAQYLHAADAMHGDLGMGKSEIARTIIQTLRGADTVVPSPTFTIVQSYDGISHFDLYRIEDASELVEVGLAHAMANDITLIEWPEIANDMLPENTIHIFISGYADGRKIQVT